MFPLCLKIQYTVSKLQHYDYLCMYCGSLYKERLLKCPIQLKQRLDFVFVVRLVNII